MVGLWPQLCAARCPAPERFPPSLQVGITLTEASVVVFAELYWNPGHLIQVRGYKRGAAVACCYLHTAAGRELEQNSLKWIWLTAGHHTKNHSY